VPRRARRPLALLAVPALLLPALAACGSDGTEATGGLEVLDITGEIGMPPEVAWSDDYGPEDTETEVLVEGDGPTLEADGEALVHYWIGNGYTEDEALSTYAAAPEVLDLSSEDLPAELTEPLVGKTVGSRVVTSLVAEDLFGEVGRPDLNVANQDPLVVVFDILGPYAVDVPFAEEGTGFTPDLVLDEESGEPTAMRFKGRPAPTGDLQVETLVEGGGAEVQRGDYVMVDYIGSVYAKPKPFDTSFDGEPLVSQLVPGSLIPGWVRGLTGQTVGSRVVLAIPPRLGYGSEGNEGANIKGTDTLYFVIDILGAAPQVDLPEEEPTEVPEPTEGPTESEAPPADEDVDGNPDEDGEE